MLSRQSRLTHFVLAICVGLGALPTYAQNVSYSSKPKVFSAFSKADKVNELYIAVIGEVNKPGTYHLDPSTLNLHAVIRRAGGLTSDATRAIHVVRKGRITHQERYSDTTNSLLQPGDLLIVESSQPQGSTGAVTEFDRESTTINASFEQPAPPASVQVALMNVLDYPLVLSLRPDEASVGQIIDHLGQGPETLRLLHVVSPDMVTSSIPDHQKAAIRLTGGAAVVFQKGVINRSRLPNGLPRPIESDIAQGAQSSLIGQPSGQSFELHRLGEKAFQSSSDSPEWHSLTSRQGAPEAVQPAPPEIKLPTEDVKSDVPQPMVKLRPRIATLPFTGDPQFANSSTRQADSDRSSAQVPIPQLEESVAEDASPSPTLAPSLSMDEEPVAMSKPASSTIPLVILFAILGVMTGVAFLLRRQRPTAPTVIMPGEIVSAIEDVTSTTIIESSSAIAPKATKSNLEQLIKNELPITYETVAFPAGLELQGRLVPKPILRVDDAQNVVKQNGPHFGLPEQESSGYSLQEVIAQLDAPATEGVRRPHFMDARPQEVVTASVPAPTPPEPTAEVERPHASLAQALFELEQGGRS